MQNKFVLIYSLIVKNPLRVVLADDDGDDRQIFLEAMSQVAPHAATSFAETGAQLMNMLSDLSAPLPDIIFLDLNMPGKSGFECLAEIHNNERTKNHPHSYLLYFQPAGGYRQNIQRWSESFPQ